MSMLPLVELDWHNERRYPQKKNGIYMFRKSQVNEIHEMYSIQNSVNITECDTFPKKTRVYVGQNVTQTDKYDSWKK